MLTKVYGHSSFLPGQEDAVKQIHGGLDSLVIIPTGMLSNIKLYFFNLLFFILDMLFP